MSGDSEDREEKRNPIMQAEIQSDLHCRPSDLRAEPYNEPRGGDALSGMKGSAHNKCFRKNRLKTKREKGPEERIHLR